MELLAQQSQAMSTTGGCSRAVGVLHSDDIAFQGTAMVNVGPVPFLRLKRHPSMGWDEEGAGEETGRKQGSKVKCQGKGVGREMQGLNVKCWRCRSGVGKRAETGLEGVVGEVCFVSGS